MLRRFGCLVQDLEVKDEIKYREVEIILNTRLICAIRKDTKHTFIHMDNGSVYMSAVDYRHLADAMDGQ